MIKTRLTGLVPESKKYIWDSCLSVEGAVCHPVLKEVLVAEQQTVWAIQSERYQDTLF